MHSLDEYPYNSIIDSVEKRLCVYGYGYGYGYLEFLN